jgi:ABC-2 type transport system permease protein
MVWPRTIRHARAIAGRDLASFLRGPMAWLILLAFQAIAALDVWRYLTAVEAAGQGGLGSGAGTEPVGLHLAGSLTFWMAVLMAVPALSMRSIAEERRAGTLETLLTSCATPASVVLGKWAAVWLLFVLLLAPFALYLPFLHEAGGLPIDPGPVVGLGLGMISLGAMFAALGVLFSAWSRSQVVAAVGTFTALFLLVVGTLAWREAAEIRRSAWSEAAAWFSLLDQIEALARGRLDLRMILLHQSVTALALFGAIQGVEFRRTP